MVHGQQRACMPVYIGKSGDLVGWHRCLTDRQTTEYRATQLLYSIQFKLSHAIGPHKMSGLLIHGILILIEWFWTALYFGWANLVSWGHFLSGMLYFASVWTGLCVYLHTILNTFSFLFPFLDNQDIVRSPAVWKMTQTATLIVAGDRVAEHEIWVQHLIYFR